MSISYFNSAEELITVFNIGSNTPYERIITLNNRKVGFSVQRKYPLDIRYKPPKLKNGEADTVAIIHVVYEHPEEDNKQKESASRIPITITIGPYARYPTTHFGYDYSDNACPTKESIEKSKLTPKPIMLDYTNEFFYDHNNNQFYDDTGQLVSGLAILDKVYKEHCDTVHLLKGLKFGLKIRSLSLGISTLDILERFLTKTLVCVFGRTLDNSKSSAAYWSGYKKENLKRLSTETLTIFGYSTARRVIILFCLLAVLVFTFCFFAGVKYKYLKTVIENPFLFLVFSIITIWLLDVVIPVLLFHIIDVIIKIRGKLWRAFS